MWTALLLALCPALQDTPAEPQVPRLLVVVSVDQLVPGQVERLGPLLTGGLGRLLREGRGHGACFLPYAATETGPGHATLGTGCTPNHHHVAGNEWRDRASGRSVYCVEDPDVHGVTSGGDVDHALGQRSARNLARPTLPELLRRRWPGSRAFSISGKDRGAIGLGGTAARPCLWWDRSTGRGFMTSSAYADDLPDWVDAFNAGWTACMDGWVWEPLFDVQHPPEGTAADERSGEGFLANMGQAFPYRFSSFEGQELDEARRKQLATVAFGLTPQVDELCLDLARQAVGQLDLGADDEPDALLLSLSGTDALGHTFGPYSWEVTDGLLRLDRSLGELFDELDRRVGEGRWVCALSSDHGVLPLPEEVVRRGGEARRLAASEVRALRNALRQEAQDRFGSTFELNVGSSSIDLDERAVHDADQDPTEVRAFLAARAVALADWVQEALTLERIQDRPREGESAFLPIYRASHCDFAAHDVELVRRPGILAGMALGTSHGTAHPYDRHIPLFLYGPGVPRGTTDVACGSQDVVPTLLRLVGWSAEELGALDLDGRVILP